jgi:acyl carrier protein
MGTREAIHDFINQELLHGNSDGKLREEEQLIESGIIDSMGIMNLLKFLEAKFAFQIPSEELIPENFSTIDSISALVDRLLAR